MAKASSAHLSDEKIIVDTLRLSDAEWYACVSEMDRNASRSICQKEQRRSERVPYRNASNIVIAIHNYDGRRQYFRVRTHDLSEYGISFLHGSYIHVGTHVEMPLLHRECGITNVHATISCCTHVKNTIHRVGAEFDEVINIDDYLLAALD